MPWFAFSPFFMLLSLLLLLFLLLLLLLSLLLLANCYYYFFYFFYFCFWWRICYKLTSLILCQREREKKSNPIFKVSYNELILSFQRLLINWCWYERGRGERSRKRQTKRYRFHKNVTLYFFGFGVFGLPDYPATDFVLISPSKLPLTNCRFRLFWRTVGSLYNMSWLGSQLLPNTREG